MALVNPHGGGSLKPLLLEGDARKAELARAQSLPKIKVSSREKGDIIMLGIGGFTPLEGFMGRADWQGVCDTMKTASGLFWPIPITLSTDKLAAEGLNTGDDIALTDPDNGEILATMKVTEKYAIDKAHECATVFKTTDLEHPGVKMVMDQGDINLAGPIKVLSESDFPEKYGDQFLSPKQTRALFESMGWSKVAAFQTRNPMHRSHEYLAKVAIETCDGVPREALLHALFRQNYGCSHLIVGRDHAGVGSYYGPFDAHHIFDELPKGALETQALKIDWTFWCYQCGGMASARTCPHGDADRLLLSGTKLRKMLSEDGEVPAEFSRPEVLAILREYYAGLTEKVEVKLTGHSAR